MTSRPQPSPTTSLQGDAGTCPLRPCGIEPGGIDDGFANIDSNEPGGLSSGGMAKRTESNSQSR
jgi:hypothetical protein